MKVICPICPEGTEVEEAEYPLHMQKFHSEGQLASLLAKKNVPKVASNLPPGINPGDLPSPNFLQTMREIEKEQQKPPPLPQTPVVANPDASQTPSNEPPQPIRLEYIYTGRDEQGHPVNTLEVSIDNEHFVVAYCILERLQIKSRKVPDLNETNNKNVPGMSKDNKTYALPIFNRKREILFDKVLRENEAGEINLEQRKTPKRINKKNIK